MIKLDDNLLQELGLGVLPPEEKKRMLAHIYETLEMRVGMELAKQMSDAQLNEFEEFINRNDEAGALRWLETNFPNYKDVVAAEFEKLKSEVRQVAPQIVASSQQAMQAGAAPQQYAATPGYQQPMQPAGPGQQYAPQPQPYQNQPYQQPAGYPVPQQPQGMPQQPYPPQQQPSYSQQPQDAGAWGQPPAGIGQQGQGLPPQQQSYQQPQQPSQQQQTQGDYDLAA